MLRPRGDILTDWRTFMSGAGVGLIDLRVDAWRPPSLLLEADPPDQSVVRQIIERVLSPGAMKILWERFIGNSSLYVPMDPIVYERKE